MKFDDKYLSNFFKNVTYNSIVNIYTIPLFIDIYEENNVSFKGEDFNFLYRKLNYNDKILELAAGSGRIMIPLINRGFYDIKGIELEKEMINRAPKEFKHHFIEANIFDSMKLKNVYSEIDVFLLFATSISLFSIEEICKLLRIFKEANSKFKIIFDYIYIDNLVTNMPLKHVNNEGIFYIHNFHREKNIIFNIFHKESNLVGYSIKYNHSLDDILSVFYQEGFVCDTTVIDDYYIIEGIYNEK